jgi:predicted enzyme related to lactoylglutathione lyase
VTGPAHAGAFTYARDIERVSAFYQRVVGLELRNASNDRHVLASPDFQLIVLPIPESELPAVPVTPVPVQPRPAAIKLFFTVPDLAAAAAVAESLGGAVFGTEYAGPGFRARNACDPEGNIFQLRELRPD